MYGGLPLEETGRSARAKHAPRQALETQDMVPLERAAHTLKGHGGYMGAQALREHAAHVEKLAQEEQLDALATGIEALERTATATAEALSTITWPQADADA